MFACQHIRLWYKNFCYGINIGIEVSKFAAFHTDCYFTICTCCYGTDQSSIGFLDFKLGSWYWITCLSVDLFDGKYRFLQVLHNHLNILVFAKIYGLRAITQCVSFRCSYFCDFIYTNGYIFQCSNTIFCCNCGCVATIYLFYIESSWISNDFACLLVDLGDSQPREFAVEELQARSLSISYSHILRCLIQDISFYSGYFSDKIGTVWYILPCDFSFCIGFACCSPCTFSIDLHDFILHARNRFTCFCIFFFCHHNMRRIITKCCRCCLIRLYRNDQSGWLSQLISIIGRAFYYRIGTRLRNIWFPNTRFICGTCIN